MQPGHLGLLNPSQYHSRSLLYRLGCWASYSEAFFLSRKCVFPWLKYVPQDKHRVLIYTVLLLMDYKMSTACLYTVYGLIVMLRQGCVKVAPSVR